MWVQLAGRECSIRGTKGELGCFREPRCLHCLYQSARDALELVHDGEDNSALAYWLFWQPCWLIHGYAVAPSTQYKWAFTAFSTACELASHLERL